MDYEGLYNEIKGMQEELKKQLQEAADHDLAKNIAQEIGPVVPSQNHVHAQLDDIKNQLKHQRALIDAIEQYGRRNIVQLKKSR